jgi:hypothetical protein
MKAKHFRRLKAKLKKEFHLIKLEDSVLNELTKELEFLKNKIKDSEISIQNMNYFARQTAYREHAKLCNSRFKIEADIKDRERSLKLTYGLMD